MSGQFHSTSIPVLAATLTLGLAACQIPSTRYEQPLLYEQVHAGQSRVVLNQPVTIPPQTARAFIQGGQEIPRVELERWTTNCELEVRTLSDTPRRVEPDEFKVVKVVHQDTLVTKATTPVMVAGGGSSGAADVVRFFTRMTLRSDRQPDVLYFTCGQVANFHSGYHMSFRQFEQTVGGLVSLVNP